MLHHRRRYQLRMPLKQMVVRIRFTTGLRCEGFRMPRQNANWVFSRDRWNGCLESNYERCAMNIVVIGGSGQIGKKLSLSALYMFLNSIIPRVGVSPFDQMV